jgi:hypothetical protein
MIEILSPGNKSTERAFEQFVAKSVSAIRQGIHLLVADLFPPTQRDPQGVHGAIWDIVGGEFRFPGDDKLTLAAYVAQGLPEAFVELIAVGATLPDMPLFLDVGGYIHTPLESTYMQAYRGMPSFLRDILEDRAPTEWDGEQQAT